MPIAGHTSQSEALSFSPTLSECGDLSGMRRRLSARDIESFACGLRLSSDNFFVLTWQDMDRTGYEGVS